MIANQINEILYVFHRAFMSMLIIMGLSLIVLSFCFVPCTDQWITLLNYYWATVYTSLFNQGLMMTDHQVLYALYTQNKLLDILRYSFVIGLLSIPLLIYVFFPYKKKKYIRGAKFNSSIKLRFSRGKGFLKCGKYRIPEKAESRHFFIVGKPGTGKTVFMLQLLDSIAKHQSKCMVYDFKGDYISHFYNSSQDLIFNPVDKRSVYWNFFDDIETTLDIETITSILIPQNKKEIWNDAARDVLTGIIYYLWEQNRRTISDLWECLTCTNQEIANILQQTEHGKRGYKYIQEVDSKQTVGVIATLTQFTKCFELIRKPQGEPFTIKEWLKSKKGCLFVGNYSNSQAILRPVLTLFIDLLSKKLLDVTSANQKTYVLVDELGTLNRLEGVKRLLTLGRSYECSCFLGIQDVAQLDSIYGSDTRKTILNSCGNWLIFGVSDYDTAKVCSNRIGETESYEIEKSYQTGKKGGSAARRKKREPLVLPSQLQTMTDLSFYFLIGNGIYKNRLTIKYFELQASALKLRSDLRMKADVIVENGATKIIEIPKIELNHIENELPNEDIQPNELNNQNESNANHINQFIDETTEPDAGGRVLKKDLFEIYGVWCESKNFESFKRMKFYKQVDTILNHKSIGGKAFYLEIKIHN
jgi:hypothetical protein